MTNADDLEARLQRHDDIEEIRRLKAAYCAACDDDHNGDRVAALFAADGTWQRSGEEPNHGPAAIAEYMFRIRNARIMNRSAHMVTNPVIDVDGDIASADWRFMMMYTHSDDETFTRIIGRYEDTYVRTPDGWRFQSLLAVVEEAGRYQAAPDFRRRG